MPARKCIPCAPIRKNSIDQSQTSKVMPLIPVIDSVERAAFPSDYMNIMSK
jgi:hypothetical protein